jgi:ferritin-like metal-binding protein YciE
MFARTLQAELAQYLTDAHAVEQHALARLRDMPNLGRDPSSLAHVLRGHLVESEQHERMVRERLLALDAGPSSIEDAIATTGDGVGPTLFTGLHPDTPGKLAAHAYSFEHLELAAYELLARMAERAGDLRALSVALRIRDEEQAMADRLADLLDGFLAAAARRHETQDWEAELVAHLADVHALERQAVVVLARAQELAGDGELGHICEQQLARSETHAQRVEERLYAHEAGPATVEDAALRLGELDWSLFFPCQTDTTSRLLVMLFAFEHLEVASLQQLARVAGAAGDENTAAAARAILAHAHAAVADVRELFGTTVETSSGSWMARGSLPSMR